MAKQTHRRNTMSAEKRAEIAVVRERFDTDRPSMAQLLRSCEYVGPIDPNSYRLTQEIARQFRAIREEQQLSIEDLAERSGLDKSTVSRLETGGLVNPTVTTLGRYAAALGRSVGFVLRPQ
ncbi:MAG: helix-turn-helix transcriptional regulator [Planctomycetaceae bacterium]|nr:helix-turn-helix transcriptional regulator [Planctomycetaceae bacterium]